MTGALTTFIPGARMICRGTLFISLEAKFTVRERTYQRLIPY